MYVSLPEETHRSEESVIKYADHMRISILRNAIKYITWYDYLSWRTSVKTNMPVQRNSAYHTLIYTEIEPRGTRVWCEALNPIPKHIKMTMQYVSTRLR